MTTAPTPTSATTTSTIAAAAAAAATTATAAAATTTTTTSLPPTTTTGPVEPPGLTEGSVVRYRPGAELANRHPLLRLMPSPAELDTVNSRYGEAVGGLRTNLSLLFDVAAPGEDWPGPDPTFASTVATPAAAADLIDAAGRRSGWWLEMTPSVQQARRLQIALHQLADAEGATRFVDAWAGERPGAAQVELTGADRALVVDREHPFARDLYSRELLELLFTRGELAVSVQILHGPGVDTTEAAMDHARLVLDHIDRIEAGEEVDYDPRRIRLFVTPNHALDSYEARATVVSSDDNGLTELRAEARFVAPDGMWCRLELTGPAANRFVELVIAGGTAKLNFNGSVSMVSAGSPDVLGAALGCPAASVYWSDHVDRSRALLGSNARPGIQVPLLGGTHLLLTLDDLGGALSGADVVPGLPRDTSVTRYDTTVEAETFWPSGWILVVSDGDDEVIYDERVEITRINDDAIVAGPTS